MHKDVWTVIQRALGAKVMGLYLVGSHGTDTAIAGSDVDYVCIIREPLTALETIKLQDYVRASLRERCHPCIDIRPITVARVLQYGLGIKREGRFLGGEDIRALIEEPPKCIRDQWLVDAALRFVENIHGCPVTPGIAISYPDANEEFRGYLEYQNPKPLAPLMSLSYLATAWLSVEFDIIVTNKHQLPQLYREYIGDAYLPYLDDLFTLGRGKYQLKLPEQSCEHAEIRQLCDHALPYENQMLSRLVIY